MSRIGTDMPYGGKWVLHDGNWWHIQDPFKCGSYDHGISNPSYRFRECTTHRQYLNGYVPGPEPEPPDDAPPLEPADDVPPLEPPDETPPLEPPDNESSVGSYGIIINKSGPCPSYGAHRDACHTLLASPDTPVETGNLLQRTVVRSSYKLK